MKIKLLIITAMLGISTLASCSPTGTSVNPVSSSEQTSSFSSGESSFEASSEEEIINYSKDINDYYGGYYSSISSWTNGVDLKNQLNALISKNIKKSLDKT